MRVTQDSGHPRAMPLVAGWDAVDTADRFRVAADRERDPRTHDRQCFPIDVVDGVPGTLVVGIEPDTGLAAP